MPMLRISDVENAPRLHGGAAPLLPTLRHALACDAGPVTIMVHGFRYQPGAPGFCPHDGILSRSPLNKGPRMVSWPRHLGLRGQPGEGLGISFGWSARGHIQTAYDNAARAGASLAVLIDLIAELSPGRPIRLIGHSLGARVALQALQHCQSAHVSHAILLAAAEFGSAAKRALAQKACKAPALLNVTSRENDLYDFLLERLVKRPEPGERVLGHGCTYLPNMVTLQLDDPKSLSALKQAGYPIARPQRRVCHWSPYLRPGVFPLYRAFLRGTLDLAQLRQILPERSEPRWSRLLPVPKPPMARHSFAGCAGF